MKTTILVHPRVLAAVTATLRSCGLRNKVYLPDAIAEVQTRALEWARDRDRELPSDPEEAAKLCTTIAINWRIDETRRKQVRRPHEAGLCEEPDRRRLPERDREREHPLDIARKLQVFLHEVREARMPAHSERIVVGVAEGKSQAEIARELGVTEHVVHNTLADLRKRFKTKLAALGLLIVLTTLAVAWLVVPVAEMAQWDPAPATVHPGRQRSVHVRDEVPETSHEVLDLEESRELDAKPH